MKKSMIFLFFLYANFLIAQDSILIHQKNPKSILLQIKYTNKTSILLPKYKQGFFCNFEDNLNRKKVPIDFSLGKNKY